MNPLLKSGEIEHYLRDSGAKLALVSTPATTRPMPTPAGLGYGLSETSPTATFNRPEQTKPGSIGVPIQSVELKLVGRDGTETPPGEMGEIAIRGHNAMKGYWNQPEATAAAIVDGWFHSGDMATRDDDGFYFVVDRKKDMIIRAGFNIYRPGRRPTGGAWTVRSSGAGGAALLG
jgi:long-chain acyl-CoA synthetase